MRALLRNWFKPSAETPASRTYIALVARARNPFFYDTLGVPDTLDGRFELIVLHLYFLQQRLLVMGTPEAEEFSRQLSEAFFIDMDNSVRELGVSDSGVRYRIKAVAKAYHGRLQAYTKALGDDEALRHALVRNLYGTVAEGDPAQLARMVAYVRETETALATQPVDAAFRWPEHKA